VRDHVAAEGQTVDWVCRLDDAEAAIATTAFDMILLDLNLPDGKGLDFLKRLRRDGRKLPVIILTAMDQISSRIDGLNAGADDYLVKPFDLSELTARLLAVSRRYAGDPNPMMRIADLEIDLAHRAVFRDGVATDVTAREWSVLERLLRHPGTVVSRSQLEDSLYAFGAEVESNAVEVYVSRLRRKLGREVIATVRGLGYRIAPR
jgi:two-component system OmpR family response regulator